jgi:hypothetical protein
MHTTLEHYPEVLVYTKYEGVDVDDGANIVLMLGMIKMVMEIVLHMPRRCR